MIDTVATPALSNNGTIRTRSRAALIALWLTQIVLAALFLIAGGSKLAGVPAMVSLFETIGVGQWFRYVTGVIEVTSAIALLVPATAALGALLIIPTMLGAIITHVFVVHSSPAVPLLLLIGAVAVAWVRRQDFLRWTTRLRR